MRAEFTGAADSAYSEMAAIHVTSGEQAEAPKKEAEPEPSPEPVLEPSPEPAETPKPTPYVPTPVPVVEVTPIPVEIAPQQNMPEAAATSEPEARMLQVVALWNDNSNAYGARPPYVIVELYRDDSLYSTAVLNADGNWSHTFTQLAGGNYKVREAAAAGYTLSYSALGNTVSILHTYNAYVPSTPAPTLPPVSTPYPAYTQAPAATQAPAETPAASPAGAPAVQNTPAPTPFTAPAVSPAGSAEPIDPLPSGRSSFGLFIGLLAVLGVVFVAAAVVLLRRPGR